METYLLHTLPKRAITAITRAKKYNVKYDISSEGTSYHICQIPGKTFTFNVLMDSIMEQGYFMHVFYSREQTCVLFPFRFR